LAVGFEVVFDAFQALALVIARRMLTHRRRRPFHFLLVVALQIIQLYSNLYFVVVWRTKVTSIWRLKTKHIIFRIVERWIHALETLFILAKHGWAVILLFDDEHLGEGCFLVVRHVRGVITKIRQIPTLRILIILHYDFLKINTAFQWLYLQLVFHVGV